MMAKKYSIDFFSAPIPASVETEVASFRRFLLAENRAPKTVETYIGQINLVMRYLAVKGMLVDVRSNYREHIEAFLVDTLESHKPNTARRYYESLHLWFNWLVEEGEIEKSPMERLKPPHVPETPPDVIPEDYLRKLLKECDSNSYEDRRDTAIIRLFVDTGLRLSELLNLKLTDIDLDMNVAYVLGKGRRPRACPFGRKTALAIDRYLRIRSRHKHAESEMLWLGREGAYTKSGIPKRLNALTDKAGLPRIHPHLFRHTFAHMWLDGGGQEGDLRIIGGWNSPEVMRRYGKKLAADRAREAHKRLSPGDRL